MNNREILLQYAQKQAPGLPGARAGYSRPSGGQQLRVLRLRASVRQLAAEGFDVKVDVAGHRTGFTACYKARRQAPCSSF